MEKAGDNIILLEGISPEALAKISANARDELNINIDFGLDSISTLSSIL